MTTPLQTTPQFVASIDLWDETLREGAERSPLSPTIDEKCDLAAGLADIGIRTLVVGMFPDVPHNIELLRALLERRESGELGGEVKLVIISHLGRTLDETVAALEGLGASLEPVWVLGIHSASDMQIEHLYPVIRQKGGGEDFDAGRWATLSRLSRREENLEWVAKELERLAGLQTGGVAIGMLDALRADPAHLAELAIRAELAGVLDARLVDTAGTCVPQQIETHVTPLVQRLPAMRFYGHFHNDFGLATANALLGLAAGLTGVDVSVGGFANRAGHPALAEVVMSLRLLYDLELPNFHYDQLYGLSRKAEQVYGLMESPAQAITGPITHGVLSGIRTQLLDRAPTIFDVISPDSVGAKRDRLFGVRSGLDGMRRFLGENSARLGLSEQGVDLVAEPIFDAVMGEWQRRTTNCASEIRETIARYHVLLRESSAISEGEMIEIITANMEETGDGNR